MVKNEIAKQKPIKEVIAAMQEKNIEKHKADGTWQKEQDRLAKLAEDLKKGAPVSSDDLYEGLEIPPGDIPF